MKRTGTSLTSSAVIVYSAPKHQFLRDNDDREIAEVIASKYIEIAGRNAALAELIAWQNSLSRMAGILRDTGIPDDAGVAIEFHIPQSSKRIDILLTGMGAAGVKNAVIVELKQWETATATNKDAIIKSFVGGGVHELAHPSYQAWSYATLLEGFNSAVYGGGISLRPCAYLHNYRRDGVIDDDRYSRYTEKAPLFLKGEAEIARLRAFIKEYLRSGDSAGILTEIENAEIRPSKALADSLTKLMKGNEEFVLIDDQKVVYETALAAGQSASSVNPRVVVIEGGPGTGKTVVAINLLVALTAKGLNCRYVSRNAAPRDVFQAKLTGSMKKTKFASLFTGSGAFTETPRDAFDVLIVDEAHRLNEKSGLYQNLGDHQIKELIASAKCTIFFLDEDQRVTLKDIGSLERIHTFALEKGAAVEDLELTSQFRCNGSDGYIAWLDHTLQIRKTANTKLDAGTFDFRVFDSPSELHRTIEEKNAIANKARVVAGYCWPWASKKDPSAFDITIGTEYQRRWNLAAQGNLWIIDKESVSEVGCIHTCQGLELDYVGVIVGPDFVVRDGVVVTDAAARAPQDRSVHGYKSLRRDKPEEARAAADLIIKNTYRTLMTRGMKGCFIYCTDRETSRLFRRALEGKDAY